MTTPEPEIICERQGAAGLLVLNRPKALNALTHNMVLTVAAQLREWAANPAITRVVLTAAGDRAFCAGGDLRFVVELCRAGRSHDALRFWADEYIMNTLIKRFPKPFVSLIDGICMGGGVGISVHGSHRVAGGRFLFAMPEVNIGFFPDVGGTWFLPRLPGESGAYCALTGERLMAADAVSLGIATHAIASERFADLRDALYGTVPVDAILGAFSDSPATGPLAMRRAAIDRLFAGDDVETILSNLDREASGGGEHAQWAAETAAAMRKKCPTSLRVALAQVRRGKELTFDQCMQIEYRLATRLMQRHDFHEGVRAVLLDKDHAPRWRPETLAQVSGAEVDQLFAPLESGEWQAP